MKTITHPLAYLGIIGLITSTPVLAADSTTIASPEVTVAQAQNNINQSQCVLTAPIRAVIVLNSGGTGAPKMVNCPAGYIAAGLKAYVALGMSNGQYYWQTNCCKSYVSYPTQS